LGRRRITRPCDPRYYWLPPRKPLPTQEALVLEIGEFYFTPELRLKDGRVIRDIEDALSFAREQEVRPGVDQRDEVLHKMERAESKEEAHAAAHSFLRWLEELNILE